MSATPSPTSRQLAESQAHRNAEVESFFAELTDAQARFVRVVTDAGSWLDGGSVELAELAAVQARVTQQLFDAQRSILRRRAEVESTANRITRRSELEAQAVVDAALAEAADLCVDLDEVTAFGDVLAMRRDGRVPQPPVPAEEAVVQDDPAVVSAERQLQALLDEWWRLEVAHGQLTIDDANARAAVCLHLAEIEAGEIREAARAVYEAGLAPADPGEQPIADTESELPALVAGAVPALPSNPPPLVHALSEALETTDPAALDALLASFLDALRDPPAGVVTPDAHAGEASNAEAVVDNATTPAGLAVPAQDAFDRFWGSGHGRASRGGVREWVFVQMLLPMVAVVVVLALVLAWIG